MPSRSKAKARRESGIFLPLPMRVLESRNFINLSSKGKALLLDVCTQIRFGKNGTTNNGDLCITPKIMKERGWTSNESLDFAKYELEYYGFISLTRLGGRNTPNLYAVTWWAIDECGGKLDVASTNVPSGEWKVDKPKWRRPQRRKKDLNARGQPG